MMFSEAENKVFRGVNFAVPAAIIGEFSLPPNVRHVYFKSISELNEAKDGTFGMIISHGGFDNLVFSRVLSDYGKVILKLKTEEDEFEGFGLVTKVTDGKYWYYHLMKRKADDWWKK